MTRDNRRQTEGGFALVNAIFVLVVLAALGAYMVTISGVQSRTPLFGLQGQRAYHAARSGLDWGIARSISTGSCAAGDFTVEGFTITVACQSDSFNESGTPYNVYRLSSFARQGTYGSADYVSRRLEAKVTDVAH